MHLTIAALDLPEGDYQPDWIEIQDHVFENERLVVDNHQFARCSFVRCKLIYSGGPYGFLDCELDLDTRMICTGAAQRALRLVESLRQMPSRLPPLG